ncbi:hypothetical protein AX760_05685 [Pararhizobium antarcticum]|uniref:DUF3828 domain-containing protein n=1 Tax=Pararhizobium antarcticum TaxID=1798805 RepID=A0A657LP15_9HYPH|nr:DUF3828 domain-containing protein [Pararhizobium antarcticum]OJF93516.1 hypothetical protein AX760_05685 [Pararhizobium antarcticum]OJG00495.1 hypothetical protein AX761_08285 [Rhizobium sp. 58]
MRLLAALFAALTALFALPAAAETYGTPEALLEALYSYDTRQTDETAPSLYSPFFSEGLNAVWQADIDKTPEGDMGAIGFDPVISGQDGEATNVEVGQPIILDDTAEVEVTFTNFEPVTLYYTLVRENGGWKVDDIASQQGEYPWSLRALFEGN